MGLNKPTARSVPMENLLAIVPVVKPVNERLEDLRALGIGRDLACFCFLESTAERLPEVYGLRAQAELVSLNSYPWHVIVTSACSLEA